MKLNETVTEGTARINVLKLAQLPNFKDTEAQTGLIIKKSKPDIEVDEIYQGTFNIYKNMSISIIELNDQARENWIRCCFEGWDTLPPIYQRKFGRDTKGIFDCRCHLGYAYGIEVPLIHEAQFHNVSDSKYPQIMICMDYAEPAKHTPRRPVEESWSLGSPSFLPMIVALFVIP